MRQGSNLLIGAGIGVWLIATVFCFWHFEGQYLLPVSHPVGAAFAEPERLPPPPLSILTSQYGTVKLAGNQPITVLNFWNPRCPCSRYAETDVRQLINRYAPRGIRFVTVIAAGKSDSDVRDAYSAWSSRSIAGTIPVADRNNEIAMKFGVWAAPAAVILDGRGQIEYTGAYNVARYCSDPNTAWAAKALSAIVGGKKPPRAKTLFFGCQLNTDAS